MFANALFQVVSALDYLHTKLSVIHRDVKPSNILVSIQKHDPIFLSDFNNCCQNSFCVVGIGKVSRLS